jgi:hypothetical protein
MEFIRRALFGMKIKLNSAGLAAVFFAATWLAAVVVRAQQNGGGHTSDFSSVEYFDAPHAQQMKSRMSGAEASPQPGGLLVIKQLKLEKFDVDGKVQVVVEAPECVYDSLNGTANSAGHLQMQTGDGKLHIEGEGFLWRQTNQWLTISNRVETVIDGALESKTGL